MPKLRIEGMKELEKTIKRLEKLPQKCVTKAVKKGSTIPLKSARTGGWIDQSGDLRKGIILKGEKSKTKGKKVYQVTMDSGMNDRFVKITKSGKRYYYPASQEYGFRLRNGGYVPGFHFLRDGLEKNSSKVQKEIVNVLSKEIDKLK